MRLSPRLATLVATLGAAGAAMADGPTAVPDASSYVTAISTGQSNYSAVMWGLALIATGIMVGVKWIKRGRGAA